mmetsp:Transcript_37924/g.82080  ORF Transcript_37924/g.82080 Transcript_37924/m.82080 type:complete len:93 (-) Transcript_37924:860-1138(-)
MFEQHDEMRLTQHIEMNLSKVRRKETEAQSTIDVRRFLVQGRSDQNEAKTRKGKEQKASAIVALQEKGEKCSAEARPFAGQTICRFRHACPP